MKDDEVEIAYLDPNQFSEMPKVILESMQISFYNGDKLVVVHTPVRSRFSRMLMKFIAENAPTGPIN